MLAVVEPEANSEHDDGDCAQNAAAEDVGVHRVNHEQMATNEMMSSAATQPGLTAPLRAEGAYGIGRTAWCNQPSGT